MSIDYADAVFAAQIIEVATALAIMTITIGLIDDIGVAPSRPPAGACVSGGNFDTCRTV